MATYAEPKPESRRDIIGRRINELTNRILLLESDNEKVENWLANHDRKHCEKLEKLQLTGYFTVAEWEDLESLAEAIDAIKIGIEKTCIDINRAKVEREALLSL